MASIHSVGLVVGILVFIPVLVAASSIWLSRHAPWMIATFGVIAVISLVAMVIRAIVAHSPQPTWLVIAFTISLIMAFFGVWAMGLDEQ